MIRLCRLNALILPEAIWKAKMLQTVPASAPIDERFLLESDHCWDRIRSLY
ncbi:hypothetical protein N8637_01150 [Verrucomicrobia bacterium]|nr:hypothetical protein [Verrucomicrobiota bacterium]